MVRLQLNFLNVLSNLLEKVSIPQWFDYNNKSLYIFFDNGDGLNSTMVRLQPINTLCSLTILLLSLNSTMVRLQRESMINRCGRCGSSQFHNGSITTKNLYVFIDNYDTVSIPQWFDYNNLISKIESIFGIRSQFHNGSITTPLFPSKNLIGILVSIPQWFDYNR